MRARIMETEWWPVLYLDVEALDEPAPGYVEGPPVYDVPDELFVRLRDARKRFEDVQAELHAFWDEAAKQMMLR